MTWLTYELHRYHWGTHSGKKGEGELKHSPNSTDYQTKGITGTYSAWLAVCNVSRGNGCLLNASSKFCVPDFKLTGFLMPSLTFLTMSAIHFISNSNLKIFVHTKRCQGGTLIYFGEVGGRLFPLRAQLLTVSKHVIENNMMTDKHINNEITCRSIT